MTIFGWDTSHYDGRLTRDHMIRAKGEGINFLHSKVGEGLTDTEGNYDDTALAGGRDAGIEFLGAYFVPRTLDSVAQVNFWLTELHAGEPWLFDWPGRYVVIDLERWTYDNVSASKGIDCAKRLRDQLGWQAFLYASHGQYGDGLTAWDGPLINADYTSRSVGGFVSMYPGDNWQPLHSTWYGGWAAYSGKVPTMLQYTSSAVIAGLSTCDANAYRGTLADLRALITGGGTVGIAFDETEQNWGNGKENLFGAYRGVGHGILGGEDPVSLPWLGAFSNRSNKLHQKLDKLIAAAAADEVRDKALQAAFDAIAQAGTSIDTAAVIDAVHTASDVESELVQELQAEIAELRHKLSLALTDAGAELEEPNQPNPA